jgi:hypothetical protein
MQHDQDLSTVGFTVRGIIDGRPSVARWIDGELVADPELVQRAQVIVGMGECFGSEDDPSHVVMASLLGGGNDVI